MKRLKVSFLNFHRPVSLSSSTSGTVAYRLGSLDDSDRVNCLSLNNYVITKVVYTSELFNSAFLLIQVNYILYKLIP